jgi:Cu-Zn family superoxide dismutase
MPPVRERAATEGAAMQGRTVRRLGTGVGAVVVLLAVGWADGRPGAAAQAAGYGYGQRGAPAAGDDGQQVVAQARADIRPLGASNVQGQARFVERRDGRVRIEVQAAGLARGAHGIHVHAVGDCASPQAPGGHFDPTGTNRHGHPGEPPDRHHAGDLPNIFASASGDASLTWETGNLSVSPGPRSVVGRAIVIHASPDDYQTDPAGGSGERIACGVITAGK